jgi:hypothetical protein
MRHLLVTIGFACAFVLTLKAVAADLGPGLKPSF